MPNFNDENSRAMPNSSDAQQLLAFRDATAVSVQYGLGMRNQEIWALTLGDIAGTGYLF
jgi:site-specific recombinase XerD